MHAQKKLSHNFVNSALKKSNPQTSRFIRKHQRTLKGIIRHLVELLRALLDLIGSASATSSAARSSTTGTTGRTTVGSGDDRVGNTRNTS